METQRLDEDENDVVLNYPLSVHANSVPVFTSNTKKDKIQTELFFCKMSLHVLFDLDNCLFQQFTDLLKRSVEEYLNTC